MQEIIDIISRRKTNEKIPESAFIRIEPKQGNILFVDGGSAEISSGPDFSVNFIRIFSVLFEGRQKIKTEMLEFFCAFYLERQNDKVIVKTKIVNSKGKKIIDEAELTFALADQTISQFADLARRISELRMAAASAIPNGTIVLDGSLDTKSELEQREIEKLILLARANKTELCALSKTTNIVSSFGESLPFLIANDSPKSRFYLPVSDSGKFRTYFLKLHPNSEYIFRCDALAETTTEIFSHLAFISNDPVFIGYPYGLIEADKFARVSNREKEILRVELMAKSGRKWQDFESKERAVNAHSVLDKIL